MGFYGLLGLLLLVILLNREEVLPSRKSRGLRIRTSFLAGGREGEPARKLVLILKPLLFLLGKTSSLLLTYNATHLLLRLDNIETEPLVELDGRVVVNLNV